MRILTVRETAWFNVDPETIWYHSSQIEEWPVWCAGLRSARWLRGTEWQVGARFGLSWDLEAAAPLFGGEVLCVDKDGVDHSQEADFSVSSTAEQENLAHGLLARRVCWRAGFGPFRSEARLAIIEDGSGSLVEFTTHWQGWSAIFGGGRRASRCARIQRDWLASLRETLERVGSIG